MRHSAALCINCGTILVSKSRHDFQQCKCSNETFLDGGPEYCRYGGQDLHMIITGTYDEETKSFEEDKIYEGVLSENPNLSSKRTTH